jgi:hypothetical protein
MVEYNITWKVDKMSRADCMAFVTNGSNSHGFFSVETPEAHLCSPSQAYQRSHGKTSGSCDNGKCQHVKVSSKRLAFSALISPLKWMEAASTDHYNYDAPMV